MLLQHERAKNKPCHDLIGPEEMDRPADAGILRRQALADALIAAGAFFHGRGWVPATGGNFSARLASDQVLITASGVHKGELQREDFLVVDLEGRPQSRASRPSYETGLHVQLYRFDAAIGAVLHVHTVANTVLSRAALSRREECVVLSGYELLKLLPGSPPPDAAVAIPVFDNDQDIARLAARVEARLRSAGAAAYLVAGHGLYAWGESVAQARHRVEALEFMFECELRSGGFRP
jgi:methylthioribulose-1-phosphate dehydratase